MLNSGYGAMTNQYFRYYKDEMAQAITLSGQLTIKWAEKTFNNYLQKLFKDEKDRVCAVDTDSVIGYTNIYVNGDEITIADYYNSLDNVVDNNIYGTIKSSSDLTLTFDNKIVERPIKYVKHHRVKKEMFEIIVDDHSVIVTEDHSIMVMRDDKLIKCNPKEIFENDKILHIAHNK